MECCVNVYGRDNCITSEVVKMNNELFNVLSKTGAFAYYVITCVYVHTICINMHAE